MSSSNRRAKEQLILLYGARDMLTGEKASKSNLTYHHCLVKKEHNGKATVENGANLLHYTHEYLHDKEMKDNNLYWEINEAIANYKIALDKNNICLIMEYEAEIMPEIEEEVKIYKSKRR